MLSLICLYVRVCARLCMCTHRYKIVTLVTVGQVADQGVRIVSNEKEKGRGRGQG